MATIRVGGVEVEISGRLGQLQQDLQQAEAAVAAFDNNTVKSGKAAAQKRVSEIKAKIKEIEAAQRAAYDRDYREAVAHNNALNAATKKRIREEIAELRRFESAQKQQFERAQTDRAAAHAKEIADLRAFEAQQKAAFLRNQRITQSRFDRDYEAGHRENRDRKVAEINRQRDIDAANRLLSEYDGMAAAQLRLNQALAEAARLRQKSLISAESEKAVIDGATAQYNKFVRSQQSNRSGQLQQHQLANLSYQANDIITGLLSGQSPGMIAAQQGGQIYQILQQSPGGAMQGLKGLSGALRGLINPYTVAIAATLSLAAAFAALAARGMDSVKMTREFDAQLTAVVGNEGFNPKRVMETARALDVYGGSLKDVKANLAEFIRKGVDPARLEEFGRAAEHFAEVWNMDVKQAGSQIATAFTGGYEEIKRLNGEFKFLEPEELKHIKRLYDLGKAGEARNEAFNKFSTVYAVAYEKQLSDMDKLHHTLAGSWDTLVKTMSNIGFLTKIREATDKAAAGWTYLLERFASVEALTKEQLDRESNRLATQVFEDAKALRAAQEELNNSNILNRESNKKKVEEARETLKKDSDRYAEVERYRRPAPEAKDTVTEEAAALEEMNRKRDRHAESLKRELDAMRANIAGTWKMVEAHKAGAAAVMKAQADRDGAVQGAKKGADEEIRQRLKLDQAIADQAVSSAELVAQTLRETEAQKWANDAVKEGTLARSVAANEAQIMITLAPLQAAIDNAEGDRKQKLIDIYTALQDALAGVTREQIRATTIDNIKRMDAENRLLEKQRQLIGATNRERAVQLAILQKELELNERGEKDPARRREEKEKAARNANSQVDLEMDQVFYNRGPEAEGRSSANESIDETSRSPEEIARIHEAAVAEIENQRQEELESIKRMADEKVLTEEQAQQRILEINRRYNQARAIEDVNNQKRRLETTQTFLGGLAQLTQSSNEKLKAIGKAAAIVQATIDAKLAIQKALASAPFPYNIPAVVFATAQAYANVQSIAALKDGGWVSGPGGPRDDKVLSMLSDKEFVVNAAAAAQHGPMLEAINAGKPPPPASVPAPRGVPSASGFYGDAGMVKVMVEMDDEANLVPVITEVSGRVAAKTTRQGISEFAQSDDFRRRANNAVNKPRG